MSEQTLREIKASARQGSGGWVSVEDKLPDEDLVVRTKIHDLDGERNDQELKRYGRLWFFPDGSTHVYYTPTHWRLT